MYLISSFLSMPIGDLFGFNACLALFVVIGCFIVCFCLSLFICFGGGRGGRFKDAYLFIFYFWYLKS